MRIAVWNMQAAFGSNAVRHERGWHYLAALDPDIGLLQETNPPDWARTIWNVHHRTAYDAQTWGSAVVVKPTLYSRVLLSEHEIPHYQGSSVVLVEIRAGVSRLTVGSIYASARELATEHLLELERGGVRLDGLRYGGEERIWPLYVIFEELGRELAESQFIVGGDFNAARLMDQFAWMPKGSIEFFDRIEAEGFTNILRKFHEVEVQTYFKGHSQPYQLDHLYCDASLIDGVESCRVVEHPVTALGLSDHAPIIAELDVP